jgi:hypothetical protein
MFRGRNDEQDERVVFSRTMIAQKNWKKQQNLVNIPAWAVVWDLKSMSMQHLHGGTHHAFLTRF